VNELIKKLEAKSFDADNWNVVVLLTDVEALINEAFEGKVLISANPTEAEQDAFNYAFTAASLASGLGRSGKSYPKTYALTCAIKAMLSTQERE